MSSLRNRILTVAVSGALVTGVCAVLADSAHAVTPPCGNSSLLVTNTPTEGATGHGSGILLFKNVTHTTCTLYGYPGLDALSSTGHVLAHAARTLSGFAGGPGVEKTIAISYAQYASAVVEWTNFNTTTSGSCTFASAVNATPPNTTHTVKLPLKTSICNLQIHPVQGGTNGMGTFALAQSEWISGSHVSDAERYSYWSKVETFLKLAGSQYATQIAELTSLMSYPSTGLTPTQIIAVQKLTTGLNSFFQTPGLYF